MSLDLTKPVQTRDGREVRVYATDGYGSHPIHGAIKSVGEWQMVSWQKGGQIYELSAINRSDLVNVPTPKHKLTAYMNVYKCGTIASFTSRALADRYPRNRVACIPVTVEYEEGEGLK